MSLQLFCDQIIPQYVTCKLHDHHVLMIHKSFDVGDRCLYIVGVSILLL